MGEKSMTATKPAMQMSELLVFARPLVIGFVGAEVWRVAFCLGANFATTWSSALWVKAGGIVIGALLCLIYAFKRGAHLTAARMGRSVRLDLLLAIGIGIWVNELASSWLVNAHSALKDANPYWAPAILLLLCTILASPLFRQFRMNSKGVGPQVNFIADEEIGGDQEDLLGSDAQARSFAETILASGAHRGLVFGVDGPWGLGKTSFINLAEQHWSKADDKVIVCRFEPLRYALEPDLADRLIRDLSAAIQRKVFAPEFRPAASRYSRLIKGKADVSFLGFKLSLEPSQETVDDLLDDIDEVLKRIGRRVIIVIDDLDRLDAKAINNVLFATRRTFNLSQATYVLCYDTEMLTADKEEGAKAREFLEKFVTVKLSLFVDSSSIRDFLRGGWQREGKQMGSIPSDSMLKLSSVLSELASILDSDLAAKYLPIAGDLRKVKRFVNAMLIMQLEKSDLGRTDFNKSDLINLILLHLNYPGVFRRIYAEETDDRSGTFSVRRDAGERGFRNADDFSRLVEEHPGSAGFLLTQLFNVKTLEIDNKSDLDEAIFASRACFNQDPFRNLEKYLKFIVRFVTPEPQETFVLYQNAVDQIRKGASVASILESPDFRSERTHDQFWRVLVNQSYTFTQSVAKDAIDTLINYLPRYSAIADNDQSLRQRSIYSLLRLLDRAGWGRASGRQLPNTGENVVEIAWRIFGEHTYQGKGLLQRLSSNDRGVLGWNDVMLFRLSCSQDRQGQLYNLYAALIGHQDNTAPTTGQVNDLALMEMRELSQYVFALFKREYIDVKKNFFAEVNDAPVEAFLGEVWPQLNQPALTDDQSGQVIATVAQRISVARSIIKSFVIYQLSNSLAPAGSGVGCGYYDEQGTGDHFGIAERMNEYVFGFCFNPDLHENNVFHFLDYCLSNLSNSFFSERGERGYFASKDELPGGLDPNEMGRYWTQYRERIHQRILGIEERSVVTSNYIASYRDDLAGVLTVLEELADGAAANASVG
jgi:KaiC/GvpD/RAD55 family RecA-like ATPase